MPPAPRSPEAPERSPQTRSPQSPTPAPPTAAVATGATAAASPAQLYGLQEDGGFILPIGTGLRLAPEWVGKAKAQIDKKHLPTLPGLSLEVVNFDPTSRKAMISLHGKTAIPLTEETAFHLDFGKDGKAAEFKLETRATLDWIGRPLLKLGWTPETGLSLSAQIEAAKFIPKSLAKTAQATGDVTLGLDQGKLSGALDTQISIAEVLKADIKGSFAPKGLAATVNLDSQTRFLGEVKGTGSIDAAGKLAASIEKKADELPTPIKGLSFKGGTLSVALLNDGTVAGGFSDLSLDYAGLASAVASFEIKAGKYAGKADLDLTVPGLTAAKGSIAMHDGKLSGAFELGKDAFPKGLPLKDGSIRGSISQTGKLDFSGSVGVKLGSAGDGRLMASYADEAGFAIAAEVDLKIPGLQTAKFSIGYSKGDLSGAGELGIDPAVLAGIQGKMKVSYEQGKWGGETTLAYIADNGKLSGNITVRARQADDKAIKISGEGEVTAQIAPRLAGKLRASILETGGIDVSGSITVTDPVPLFPEKRFEKELLNKSSNIPLWAILVAVLRIRAGVRAGIGPGVFRNITLTGSYSIGKEGEPSFSISGEMFIPAFVEGYVGFGAGLGLDVGLGSLTGGIEAMGTAGLYGAISVIPELAYKDGDYSISGVATMAAGARLKLSLNAWAEIEALWVTVWDKTWELAAVTMPIGPDLGLSAKMDYTFGKGEAPTLEFNTSDIDTDRLIKDAMPKDAPPSAGVKQETKNAAKWAGAQKAKGPEAETLPAALAQKAATPPPAAPAPAGKGKKKGAAPAPQPGAAKSLDAKTKAPLDPAKSDKQAKDAATPDPKAQGTVADDKAASTKTPRHPAQLSLATLAEPPVPMPRSKSQQEADLDAAAKLTELVSASTTDTDAVDDYFDQIKTRFALSSIGFQVDPGPTVSVKISINPDRIVKEHKEIRNLPLSAYDKDADNKIAFTMAHRTWDIGGQQIDDNVGVKMVASVLTPLHPQGSGPKDTALQKIFTHLQTQGATGAHGYIKGHLLNDNLGGPGASENLYPISQQANADHSSKIETEAKSLVNDQHYWVRYEVEIGNEKISTLPPLPDGRAAIAIDADLTATLSKLHADKQNYTPVKSVLVKSRFNMVADAFSGKTAKDLTPAEKAIRDKDSADFLAKADALAQVAGDTNASKELPLPPPTTTAAPSFIQKPVDQSQVLLSTAKPKGPALKPCTDILTALAQMAKAGFQSPPFAGASTLQERLAQLSYGTSRHDIVAGLGARPSAASTAAPDGDIATTSLLTPPELEVLRQINSDTSAKTLTDVLTRMTAERAAASRLADKGAALTKTDWAYLATKMDPARQSDRIAFAGLVAAAFGSRTAGREAMQAAGLWDQTGGLYASVKQRILALAP